MQYHHYNLSINKSQWMQKYRNKYQMARVDIKKKKQQEEY